MQGVGDVKSINHTNYVHENNLEIRQDWYIHYVHIPHHLKTDKNWAKTFNIRSLQMWYGAARLCKMCPEQKTVLEFRNYSCMIY